MAFIKIADTIRAHNLIKEGDCVLAAVSGGPDSVCMLHALNTLKDEMRFMLAAAHLNHGLRGAEADEDERYVASLCESMGIRLFHRRADVAAAARERKISLETAGREIRYEFLRETARDLGAASIAVAHNLGDRAETVLMNIIRGCGPEGLSGMAYSDSGLIRPLLDVTRREILAYCLEHSLAPRTDSTNSDSAYTRNRVRNEILPAMESIPGADPVASLIRLSEIMTAENEYLNRLAEEAYAACAVERDGLIEIDAAAAEALDNVLAGRVMRLAVRRLNGNVKDLEYRHVAKMIELASEWQTGKTLELPCGTVMEKSYGKAVLKKAEPKVPAASGDAVVFRFSDGSAALGNLMIDADIIERGGDSGDAGLKPGPEAMTQYFCAEKLGEECELRTRRPGDRILPLGAPGHKKLGDWFTDRKVPSGERDKIFLLAKGNEIVWIIGYNINDNYKAAGASGPILRLSARIGR